MVDEAIPDCRSCGACCAYSWEWPALIGNRDGRGIPPDLVADGRMRCEGNRCVALEGTIGESVRCTVYDARPMVCEMFAAGSDECRDVRRHFGLDREKVDQEKA